MAIPERYIDFKEGEPLLLKFDDYYVMPKEIFDDKAKRTKKVNTVQLHVTHRNGKPVDMELSVLSWKLQQRLQPYIESGQYKTRVFKITKHGRDFHTKYELEVL